jgi:hypothetical protein
LCAGTDDVRDAVDGRDSDAADVMYVDRGEDEFHGDAYYLNGLLQHDIVRASSEYPMGRVASPARRPRVRAG